MNYYAAKFAREAKPNPTDWIIRPVGHGRYALDFIGIEHPILAEQAPAKLIEVRPAKLICQNTIHLSGLDLSVEDMDYIRQQDYGLMP